MMHANKEKTCYKQIFYQIFYQHLANHKLSWHKDSLGKIVPKEQADYT